MAGVGPITVDPAAQDRAVGRRLTIGAAREFPGPGFLMPTCNAELFRWCVEDGLRAVQPMTLMTIGLYNEAAGAVLPSILY